MNYDNSFLWNRLKRWIDNLFHSKSAKTERTGKAMRPKTSGRSSVSDPMLEELRMFLKNTYQFRFNRLTEETEFRCKEESSTGFRPVDQRALNSICLEAKRQGIACWDRDVSRHIHSYEVEEYQPFKLYMDSLPAWDGRDRLDALARRVSDNPLWIKGFRRWMLAMAAQWMQIDGLHGNSVAPVLVSHRQGKQKSTFCKLLLPTVLQRYYTDSVDLNAPAQMERKLSTFGLINLDEFDKIPQRKMPLLKNLMQMAGTNCRKAYRGNYVSLPRMASFIATSNRKDLLSDPSGSRRFLCVEIQEKIDCTAIEHDQIYAQLKTALLSGERHWFTSEEEAEIMKANTAFYKRSIEEDVFHTCFKQPSDNDQPQLLSAAEIFQHLKKHNPQVMRRTEASQFGSLLSSLGIERVHTHYGNRYRVVPVQA